MLRKSRPGVLHDTTIRDSTPREELIPPECTTQLWADDSLEITAIKPQVGQNTIYLHVDVHLLFCIKPQVGQNTIYLHVDVHLLFCVKPQVGQNTIYLYM